MGHLDEIEEGYWEHFRHAFEVGSVLMISSLAQIAHSVFPNFHPPFGSDIHSHIEFLESKRAEKL